MNDSLKKYIDHLDTTSIDDSRLVILDTMVGYISQKRSEGKTPQLNFICTHNSRRSQFSQVWAKAIAVHYGVRMGSFSGGTAVTACNERTIESLKRTGFEFNESEGTNPRYAVQLGNEALVLYSKLFDAPENPTSDFAAVMTCSDADENCPFISGCDMRIPLRYNDPKAYDDTELESEKYDERSKQIATELKYVFEKLKSNE